MDLKCGLPSFIYSKMQLSLTEGNVRMKAADIVKDQGNLIIDHIVLNKIFFIWIVNTSPKKAEVG